MARYRLNFEAQQRGECEFLVAWLGNAPAGSVCLLGASKYESVRTLLGAFPEMNALGAFPQRQGTGTAIIRYSEDGARRRGETRMGLAVELGNEGALRLYRRLGYCDWGNGLVVDEWVELDDHGTPTIAHADECYYLIKDL